MQPIAYLNGEFLPAQQMSISIDDAGFMLGATIAEQLRTFGGIPFEVAAHLHRWWHGLQYANIQCPLSAKEIEGAIEQIVKTNLPLCPEGFDLGVTLFITPGSYRTYATEKAEPNLGIHTYPLPFHLWAEDYLRGRFATIVSITQVPATCWPADLKCRSRMHYYLAELAARKTAPSATPILLDQHGNISETPTANVIAYFEQVGLVSVPQEKVLPGISLDFVHRLADRLGVPFSFEELTPGRLRQADEVLLTSTPFCLLPVVQLDEVRFHDGKPGPVFRQLLTAWSAEVGVDIAQQAQAGAINFS